MLGQPRIQRRTTLTRDSDKHIAPAVAIALAAMLSACAASGPSLPSAPAEGMDAEGVTAKPPCRLLGHLDLGEPSVTNAEAA